MDLIPQPDHLISMMEQHPNVGHVITILDQCPDNFFPIANNMDHVKPICIPDNMDHVKPMDIYYLIPLLGRLSILIQIMLWPF